MKLLYTDRFLSSLYSVLISMSFITGVSFAEKSEIMLLIDASSSMEQLQNSDGYPRDCEWPRGGQDPQLPGGLGFSPHGGQQQDFDNLTRLQWAQWYIAGSVKGPMKCVGHDANERNDEHIMGRDGFIAHYRLMCYTKNLLALNQIVPNVDYVPCGGDHGRLKQNALFKDPDSDDDRLAYLSGSDGFIHSGNTDIRFGLMVSDSDPKSLTAVGGGHDANRQDYSFGTPVKARLPPATNIHGGNSNISAFYSEMDGFGKDFYTSSARDPRQAWVDGSVDDTSYYLEGYNDKVLNLGARGENAPNGRLIDPRIGTEDDSNLEITDNDNLNIIRHNLWLGREIRSIVPHGPSPLSAMLADLREYYENNPPNGCTMRVAVLVTDGMESTYLPTRRCNRDNNCKKQDLIGKCVSVPQSARISHERFQEGTCQGPGADCEKVCVYPEGSPYESASEIARQLKNGLNIPVIVALVGHSPLDAISYDIEQMTPAAAYAYKIAAAGSPNMGPGPGLPGLYNVEDLGSAIDLVNRLNALAGDVKRSETQPLVMTPSLGDAFTGGNPDQDLRQMRVSATGFTPAQDHRKYSDVSTMLMGCTGIVNSARGLKVLDSLDVDQELIGQDIRPVYTVNPQNNAIQTVVDGNGPLFSEDGTNTNNDYRTYIGAQSNQNIREVGLQMQGYFGRQGRTAGLEKVNRKYGGINNGDITALPPTGSARENLGDPEHYRQKRERPNLFFFGGDDGLVHAVRAFDGYNLFSFVPQTTWENIVSDGSVPIDGPMSAGEVVPCRNASGGGGCPNGAEAAVKSMVVGGVGEAGRELFGFEMTDFSNNSLRDRDATLNRWPNTAVMWSLTDTQEADLGLTVSRPALAHVNFNGQIKGVAVVGCGLDPTNNNIYKALHGNVGRCILFVDVNDGRVIHKVQGPNSQQGLRFPVVGSPTVYPNDGSAAEVIYFGDIIGQFFRLDLNGGNPDTWKLTRIWPLENLQGDQVDFERGIGHAIYERASLANADNGDRVVVFATGEAKANSVPDEVVSDTGYVVSLREHSQFDANGEKTIIIEANWVVDFAQGEFATGAPKIQDSTVFITSSRPAEIEACGAQQMSKEGRLYGVHYTKVLEASYLDPFGDRSLRVVPMIPRYNNQGERLEDALSLILPPGRTAHGFSLVPTPSCAIGASTVTELVINLTEEIGAGPDLLINSLSVEYVQGGFVAGNALEEGVGGGAAIRNLSKVDLNDALEVKMDGSLFTVSLSPGEGDQGGALFSPLSPFPSKVLYWGSGDEE